MTEIESITNIFNRYVYPEMDKKEWIDITNFLMNEIDIDKYNIIQYKNSFDNNEVVENVINHKETHSHPFVYLNPSYKEKKIKVKLIELNGLYPYCISNIWKSDFIPTSEFEDKLFYILSLLIDNYKDVKTINIKRWINLFYYMKKKSVKDLIHKLTWEVFNQVINITIPVYIDIDVLLFTINDWANNHDEITNKLKILSNDIRLSQEVVFINGEKDYIIE